MVNYLNGLGIAEAHWARTRVLHWIGLIARTRKGRRLLAEHRPDPIQRLALRGCQPVGEPCGAHL